MQEVTPTIRTVTQRPKPKRKAKLLLTEDKLRMLLGTWAINAVQVFMDYITVTGCYMASHWLYVGPLGKVSPQSHTEFFWIAAGAGILYVFLLDRVGLYRKEISFLRVKEMRGIFHVGILSALIVLSISFYVRSANLSRIMFTTAIVITPIILFFERQIIYWFQLVFHLRGFAQKRVLVYGAGYIGILNSFSDSFPISSSFI